MSGARSRVEDLLSPRPHTVVNSGSTDLVAYSLFGPDLQTRTPAAGEHE